MLSARDVAEYFLSLVNEDDGELISHLKLQKLVYYAQGFSLAIFGTPMFPEDIEAWTHGPVVPDLYSEYKHYGSGALPIPAEIDQSKYDAETRWLLEEISEVYGQFSASGLRNLTHREPPWQNTPSGETISHQALKAYFETQIEQ